jgi:hypothetical protein
MDDAIDEPTHQVYEFIRFVKFYSTLYCIVLFMLYVFAMKNHQRTLLVLVVFLFASQSMFGLGLPQRLYPAKVIKKSIQVLVRKVSR